MTSSDYMFRKPSKILFDIAIRKSGLSSDEIWYCGDNPHADVEGAHNAGIFPVWYENDTDDRPNPDKSDHIPSCEHLHIHEWHEMTELLEKL